MSKRDDRVSVRQMLDHVREAVAMVRDRSRHDLDTDRLLNLSLTRLLEIIGEAAWSGVFLLVRLDGENNQ